MDDDDFFDIEHECDEPVRWRWGILPAAALTVARGFAESVATGLRTIETHVFEDLNYRHMREQFHQDAALELETLLREPKDG